MLLEGEFRFVAMFMNNDTGSLQDKLINTMATDALIPLHVTSIHGIYCARGWWSCLPRAMIANVCPLSVLTHEMKIDFHIS